MPPAGGGGVRKAFQWCLIALMQQIENFGGRQVQEGKHFAFKRWDMLLSTNKTWKTRLL